MMCQPLINDSPYANARGRLPRVSQDEMLAKDELIVILSPVGVCVEGRKRSVEVSNGKRPAGRVAGDRLPHGV